MTAIVNRLSRACLAWWSGISWYAASAATFKPPSTFSTVLPLPLPVTPATLTAKPPSIPLPVASFLPFYLLILPSPPTPYACTAVLYPCLPFLPLLVQTFFEALSKTLSQTDPLSLPPTAARKPSPWQQRYRIHSVFSFVQPVTLGRDRGSTTAATSALKVGRKAQDQGGS